jgi:acetyl-CoA C-acetyltransferase
VTLDRFCGSGITATNLAAAQIMSGMEDCVIAGGTEMMSHVVEFGMKLREAKVAAASGLGTGNARLQAKHPQTNQGVAADAIAAMEGISREDARRVRRREPASRRDRPRRGSLRQVDRSGAATTRAP